jgi:ATP-dependent helicase/DNAse subunit B
MEPHGEFKRLAGKRTVTINAAEALNITTLATALYAIYLDSQEEFRVYAKEKKLSHLVVRKELEEMITELSREVAYYKALTVVLKNKL